MNLENQVTNLELSKKLKELGVKQESLFYWHETEKDEDYWIDADTPVYDIELKMGSSVPYYGNSVYIYSAFTVAELGEIIRVANNADVWAAYKAVGGKEIFGLGGIIKQSLNVELLAKMLIYLIENKLITL